MLLIGEQKNKKKKKNKHTSRGENGTHLAFLLQKKKKENEHTMAIKQADHQLMQRWLHSTLDQRTISIAKMKSSTESIAIISITSAGNEYFGYYPLFIKIQGNFL